jgi:hypothetical protein
MAATAEISTPSTTVTFAAVRDGLRLIKTPRYPIFGPGGRAVGEDPGESVKFADGILPVTDEGVTLEDGRVMPREQALEWLRGHRLFGNLHDGFSEVAQAAPAVTQAELETLMAAALDEGALVRLIEAEEAGWNRPTFLAPARGQLERVRELLAAQAAQAPESKPAAKRSAR